MNICDTLEYQRSKKRLASLEKLLHQLDTVGEILYNNLEYDGIWDLIERFEELRIKYYVEQFEHRNTIEGKGILNGQN